jgi:hypothetical protein
VADSKPKGPVYLSKPLAHRVGRAVKKIEATYSRPPDQRSRSYLVPFLPIQPASVTTTIPTGTLAAPSTSGQVTIYRDDDTGGLVAAETGAQCKNYHTLTASVPTGTTVSVYWRANAWWLIQPDCY